MRVVRSADARLQQVISSIYSSVLAMSRIGVTSYTHEMSFSTREHTHTVLAGIRRLFPACSIRHITVRRGLEGIHTDILVVDWS
jgi:hypothetical protein